MLSQAAFHRQDKQEDTDKDLPGLLHPVGEQNIFLIIMTLQLHFYLTELWKSSISGSPVLIFCAPVALCLCVSPSWILSLSKCGLARYRDLTSEKLGWRSKLGFLNTLSEFQECLDLKGSMEVPADIWQMCSVLMSLRLKKCSLQSPLMQVSSNTSVRKHWISKKGIQHVVQAHYLLAERGFRITPSSSPFENALQVHLSSHFLYTTTLTANLSQQVTLSDSISRAAILFLKLL